MSGSSGSSGGDDIGAKFDCETIGFTADINSPQISAIDGLEVGMILTINVENSIVVAKRPDRNEVVGSINWTYNNRLINCIEEGFEYKATIRSIDGGLIKALVSKV